MTASPLRPRDPGPSPSRASALDCAAVLRALGEESRLRILGLLLDEPLPVNEIAARAGLSQYNASRHLRILRDAGILVMQPSGQQRVYAVDESFRRHAASGTELDLGCCTFRFPTPAARSRRTRVTRPGRSRRPATR